MSSHFSSITHIPVRSIHRQLFSSQFDIPCQLLCTFFRFFEVDLQVLVDKYRFTISVFKTSPSKSLWYPPHGALRYLTMTTLRYFDFSGYTIPTGRTAAGLGNEPSAFGRGSSKICFAYSRAACKKKEKMRLGHFPIRYVYTRTYETGAVLVLAKTRKSMTCAFREDSDSFTQP